jgi:vacuolar-type H+-ATPase subunit H
MTLIAHPRNLDQVERGIEDALRSFAGREANGVELPEITAAERIDKIGNMSALAIIEASETTARDIEAAAQAAVDIAADITKEAQQLASELRASGNKIGERLREFATLAKKVSTAMRDTRAKVLSPPEEKTPLGT